MVDTSQSLSLLPIIVDQRAPPVVSVGQILNPQDVQLHSRRDFLKNSAATIGLLPLMLGRLFNSDILFQSESQWSKEEILALALKMQKQPFEVIKKAGNVLWDNQQGDVNAFIALSPLTDGNPPLTVYTKEVPFETLLPVWGVPEAAGEQIDVQLKSKHAGQPLLFSGMYTQTHLLHMDITPSLLEEETNDFFVALPIARAVYSLQAAQMAADYFIDTQWAADFILPSDLQEINALRMAVWDYKLIFENGIELPMPIIADMWAYFLLCRDFVQAYGEGVITDGDLNQERLLIYTLAAAEFLKYGVLVRRASDSKFDWTDDTELMMRSFIETAIQIAQYLNIGQEYQSRPQL